MTTGPDPDSDDSDVGWGERPRLEDDDEVHRLQEDRPPHHEPRDD
jgi:hypothetical protein